NNLLDKSEIEKERGVVLEESRLSKGAQERMMRQYFPRLFNGSKYAERLPIGTDSVLKNFKHETLSRFYKQWYRPNLMAVVVVGDIDPAVAEQKIKAHFGKAVNPANAKARPAITPIQTWSRPEALVVTDDEATHSVLQMYNFVKPSKTAKTWADVRSSMVENLVSTLINQRLQELMTKENPPFIYSYAGMSPFLRGYKAFTSFAVLGNNTAQEAVDALIGETERARRFGFLASELERAKASMLNGLEKAYNERDKSESGQIVGQYVNHFLEGNPIPGIEHQYNFAKQSLPTITLEEVNAVAKAMPSSENAFALITAPTSAKAKLPTSEGLLQALAAARSKPVTAYEEKAVAQNLMEQAPSAGTIKTRSADPKLGTTRLTLSNGVEITLKPTTLKNDQILLDAWRRGGFNKFSLEEKDQAKHAATIVKAMGVKDLSPTDLQKFLSGKTVNVSPYLNAHEEGIEGQSSVKDFETFLQLIHLYFTQPRKDAALFRSYVSKEKAGVQNLMSDPQYFFEDTLTKILYNGSPWMSEFPTPEEYDRLDLEKSFALYNQVFRNADGMHFTFVGNLDTTAAMPLLLKYLGSLPATPQQWEAKDQGVRPVQGQVEANIKRGKEQQSMIALVFTGETKYDVKENMALRALLDVLNIQVIEKLREEMGGMYGGGFGGGISHRPYTHYTVRATVPCGPENVDKLTAALLQIVKNVQEKGVEVKDLDKVKETWRKQYATNIQNNAYWLGALSNAVIDRTDPHLVLTYEQRVSELTAADVQAAARKFLNLNNYVKAVLYPETAPVPAGVQTKKAF
ncbi:MAG TPA: insulinase family protein, partial [Chitinophagaceae bacterium]|nr:insulinase family protein [Chitinophagaceae bacterium]